MSSITEFALSKNRITVVFIVLTVMIGLQQFATFPRQEDPTITIREVVVNAYFPGMSPVEIAELITRRIEAQLSTLKEIKDIWSESKTGKVVIHADTRDEYDDLDLIWQKVRNKMADIKPELPEGTIGPFVNDEFGLTSLATIALTGEGFSMSEMRPIARDIRDTLYELEGIRKVELLGVQEEQIFLKYMTVKISQYGIGIGEIIDTLVEQNVILPGGKVDVDGRDLILEPSGNFRSVDDIEAVLITIPGTRNTVKLRDLVSIERGYVDPPKDIVYFNGKPAIVISVSITQGVNAVEFGERLTEKIEYIESFLPIGYALEYATFQPDLVLIAVNGALSTVFQTVVIVLVVVMLSLGLRSGLIVGAYLVTNMLLGLVVMRLAGVELERVSISSVIIALGMLVDNGIVVTEDLRTRFEIGEERRQACIEAGKTLAIPLLIASLTAMLAFTPMLLVTGQPGDYIFSLPMMVIILLSCSWFLSMYMTPAMCYWFMKAKPITKSGEAGHQGRDPYGGRFYSTYRRFLETVLRFRFGVIALTVLVFIAGGFSARFLVREFFGPSDRNQFLVYVDLPAGYNIHATDEVVQRLATWLSDKDINPEITNTIAYVASGGPRFYLSLAPINPDPNRAFLLVNTQDPEDTPELVERVRAYMLSSLPEASGRVKRMWLGSTEPGLLEIRLMGPEAGYLMEKGNQFVAGLNAMGGVLDLRSDWENKTLKSLIRIDQARARRAELTSSDVAFSLESHLDGVKITDYREDDLNIPVSIRSVKEERATVGDLRNMSVYSTKRRATVPISQIADGESIWEFCCISHRNQVRTLTVELKHETLKAPELLEAVKPLINSLALKEGYRWEAAGELEQAAEANEALAGTMPPCLLGIIVLLIWQFNSIRRPAIIMLTIPLSFTGALIGVVIWGAPFDFFGLLGLLSLAGVIIINGIILIDRIDSEWAAGRDAHDAILTASVSRIRPILITTITSVLAVLPLVIFKDPLFYTLALILVVGMTFGTVLTLGVVPALYATFFRVQSPKPKS